MDEWDDVPQVDGRSVVMADGQVWRLHRQPDGRVQAFPPEVTVITGAEIVGVATDGTVAVRPTEAHTLPREGFEGLLHFTDRVGGSLTIRAPWAAEHRRRDSWLVEVRWQSTMGVEQSVFAEDNTFDEACTMCRGLLAHSLASGVAAR